jgi:hypothetical protein
MTRELPARYQTAILHFYLKGLGEREAAKHMGVTESSLKAQLHRSRRILIQKIRKMYLPGMCSSSFEAESSRRENLSQRHTGRIRKLPMASMGRRNFGVKHGGDSH